MKIVGMTFSALGGLIVSAGVVASSPAAESFILEISGTDGTTFEGHCKVESGETSTVIDLVGSVPINREFEADALGCELSQTSTDGEMTVVVRSPSGSATRSRTSGKGSTVRIRLQ